MVSEIALQQEGAKIAREAEHKETFNAAQAELTADLKKMTPGNYAEVLRQVLDTNRVDVRSNPILPDLYLAHSKGALMPDLLLAKTPSQSKVAERIFLPPIKSPYANFAHVLSTPDEASSMIRPGLDPKGYSDKMPPSGPATSGVVRGETRATKPENVAASVVQLVIDKALGKPTPAQHHMSVPYNNPYLKK